MKSFITLYLPAALFIAVMVGCYFFKAPVIYLTHLIEGHTFLSYVIFVWLLTVATVLMPVTVMPIIPMVAPVFGPFITGVLSIIGWTLGAVIAFLIARHLGRPIIERFVSLEKIDAYAARLGDNTQFVGIVLIRLVLPVDIMSYAIGLSSTVSLARYTLATLIGVSWFSFAFAYLGNAVFTDNVAALVTVGGASVIVFVLAWYILLRQQKKRQ